MPMPMTHKGNSFIQTADMFSEDFMSDERTDEWKKDYIRLRNECLREVKALGIKAGNITAWKLNSRAKRRLGQCTKHSDGTYEIQIAKRLLTEKQVAEMDVKEVIIHEILHTCYGCMKHTGRWKIYAEKMNASYGYHISRTKNLEQLGLPDDTVKRREIKYVYVCAGCGQRVERTRACKFTRNPQRYCCGRCGSNRWKENV